MKSLRVIDHGNSNTNKNKTQTEALLKDNNFSKLFNNFFTLGNMIFTMVITISD